MKIHIIGTAAGFPTEFDDTYVVVYDPTYNPPGEEYCGGILEVTRDKSKALDLPLDEALALWKKPYGTRGDRQANRPLTAWTVEIVT